MKMFIEPPENLLVSQEGLFFDEFSNYVLTTYKKRGSQLTASFFY